MSVPSKLEKILKAIPKDEWISAEDIAKKSGLSTHVVGALIGVNLLNKSVERKVRPKNAGRSYVYRQLVRVERTGQNESTG